MSQRTRHQYPNQRADNWSLTPVNWSVKFNYHASMVRSTACPGWNRRPILQGSPLKPDPNQDLLSQPTWIIVWNQNKDWTGQRVWCWCSTRNQFRNSGGKTRETVTEALSRLPGFHKSSQSRYVIIWGHNPKRSNLRLSETHGQSRYRSDLGPLAFHDLSILHNPSLA